MEDYPALLLRLVIVCKRQNWKYSTYIILNPHLHYHAVFIGYVLDCLPTLSEEWRSIRNQIEFIKKFPMCPTVLINLKVSVSTPIWAAFVNIMQGHCYYIKILNLWKPESMSPNTTALAICSCHGSDSNEYLRPVSFIQDSMKLMKGTSIQTPLKLATFASNFYYIGFRLQFRRKIGRIHGSLVQVLHGRLKI